MVFRRSAIYGVQMRPTVDLRPLHSFVVLAEELHFGRAAARLHIAQPSLSVQIRKLEESLGGPLLRRDSRHVELTEAGQILYTGSRRLLEDVSYLVDETRESMSHPRSTRLVVGFHANAAAELTPVILEAFHRVHPETEVVMKSFDFSDPHAGLEEGATDVAFVRPPLPAAEWMALETLFIEPRIMVVSDRSRFAGLTGISVEQLVDERFVARRAPDYWRDFWLATSARGGVRTQLGAEVRTVDECFEAILAGRGVAFSPASTSRYYARPGLTFVPVTDIPPSRLGIAWRKDESNVLVRDFVETARALALTTPVPRTIQVSHTPRSTADDRSAAAWTPEIVRTAS